jgi:hypothetical protein
MYSSAILAILIRLDGKKIKNQFLKGIKETKWATTEKN